MNYASQLPNLMNNSIKTFNSKLKNIWKLENMEVKDCVHNAGA